MNLNSKLPDVGTTVFTVMSQLANEHQAVNLGQGFPDYDMDERLIRLVNEAMLAGKNQYAPMAGLLSLRNGIAQKTARVYQQWIDPETDVTVTPGGTYAIYTALTTILCPGDEVIVFEPVYDSYIPNIQINGGTPILIPLQYPDYSINWQDVKRKITARTKAIIINSPHNPTGSVLSASDMEQLAEITDGTGIFILSDEVYEHLVYDNLQHQSILRYPQLLKRSFVCFSFGKTYNCTGWKLGYCISSPQLMAEFRKVHQFNCFSCFTPGQVALAEFIKVADAYENLPATMQAKRDFLATLMQDTPFKPLPSYGSYFKCYSYAGLSELPDKEFSIMLTKVFGVTTIPLSAFYTHGKDDKVIRLCFCKKEETLKEAVRRLRSFGSGIEHLLK